MKVTILQHDIEWCRVDQNLSHLDALTATLPRTDLLLLPEMFATGLNNAAIDIVDAQPRILAWMQAKAKALDAAVVGSIATEDGGKCYNRLHFVRPDGTVTTYDKRHLFAYGGEAENYTAGHKRVIVEWRGVRFLLQVCYDLRYPLWSRNRGDYDCILYSANFPISRDMAWRTLIRARAIENQCYVAACNRIGTDQQCEYYGRSAVIHPYGETIMDCPDKTEWAASMDIDLEFLRHYEHKFPVLEDADAFELKPTPFLMGGTRGESTPIPKSIVDSLIDKLGIQDFAKATIREVKQVAAMAEKESGVEFIKMEMGIPGLPAAQVGVDAQVKALREGIAHSYPDIQGYTELKKEASRFVKAFVGVDVAAEGCVPVSGSMQGTFASFLTCSQANTAKDTVLFIDPGFPVQKMQLQVMGVKYETFDVYDFRGEKLRAKLESYLTKGNICAIVYSNPNNPSWVCLTESELQAIGELATRYDAIVMEDLAYFAMDFRQDLSVPFQPPYQPTVARYTDNYMLLISGSKAFSYAGERIGVVCISDKLFHRHFSDLSARYEGLPFGLVFSTRMLYALSSGTSHSAQYALAAMFRAACDGEYRFRDEVKVYGERAKKLKEIFLRHGFHVVYDRDLDQPLADGFYFTIGYKGMTSGELARELMYYGVSAICLITTGSHQEGLRVCTSFIEDHQYAQLEERMVIFAANNPR